MLFHRQNKSPSGACSTSRCIPLHYFETKQRRLFARDAEIPRPGRGGGGHGWLGLLELEECKLVHAPCIFDYSSTTYSTYKKCRLEYSTRLWLKECEETSGSLFLSRRRLETNREINDNDSGSRKSPTSSSSDSSSDHLPPDNI